MGRRLSAVLLAVLLAFATTSCGDDSQDAASDDGGATQSDTGGTGGTGDAEDTEDSEEPADTDDSAADKRAERRDERREQRQEQREERQEQREEKSDQDDDSAMPDDLPSADPSDPDDLPIDADVVMQTCEDVDPSDTWPSADDVYFDTSGGGGVVATGEVEVKGGDTIRFACDVAGSEQNPHVMAYNPI